MKLARFLLRACLLLPAILSAQNLLTNASFEENIPPQTKGYKIFLLKDWQLLLNSGAKKCEITVADEGLTGRQSLRLHTIGKAGFCAATHESRFPVVPGQEITASAMLKGKGSGYIRIYYLDAQGKDTGKYKMMGRGATQNWEKCLVKFTVPEGVSQISFSLQTLRDDADVLFDDAELLVAQGDFLENGLVKVTFNPNLGGGIDAFVQKADGFDYTQPRVLGGGSGGLLNIVLPARRMPGAVMEMPFQRIHADGSRNVYKATIVSGNLAGLELTRSYELARDQARVTARLTVRNTTAKPMNLNYRIQNSVDGARGTLSWPTPDWITVFHQGQPLNGLNAIEHPRFRAGWMAKYFPENKTSLVFSASVEDMEKMYTYLCVPPGPCTLEWYCREVTLAPGESKDYTQSIQLLAQQTSFYVDERGKRQKAETIEPVKLPEPPRQAALPAQFQDFFPYGTGIGNLNLPEMAGSDAAISTMDAFKVIEPRLVRELVAAYMPNYYHFRLLFDFYLKTQKRPDGTYAVGEMARHYHMKLIYSTLFLFRKDVDVDQYMKDVWPEKLKRIDTPEFRDFNAKYNKDILCIFTGDELIPQNLPVLLRVHQELKRLLPEHIIPFPYLNSSTTDLLPYLPVFLGDWYPINRKEASGRNPWSVYGEFSKIVAKAGTKPVWFMPQGFSSDPVQYAFPTSGEMRLMLNLAAAAGVKGIIYHGFPSGGWHWMLNYGMYRYTPLGGAGQHTPTWQAIVDGGRTFATVGPLLTRCAPTTLPQGVKLTAGSYASPNGFYNGPAAKLFALKAPRGTVFIAVNQNPYGATEATLELDAPCFDFQKLAFRMQEPIHLTLKPGDAAYFCANTDIAEVTPSLKSRFRAEAARYLLLADQARGDGIPVIDPFALETNDPLASIASLAKAQADLEARVAQSPLGPVLQDLAAVKAELDRIDFRLCCAADLVITPDMREKTPKYRRWTPHPDTVFQDAKTRLAKAFSHYFRLQDAVNGGKGSKTAAAELPELKQQAKSSIADVERWLNAHPDQHKIDDPYMGMEP